MNRKTVTLAAMGILGAVAALLLPQEIAHETELSANANTPAQSLPVTVANAAALSTPPATKEAEPSIASPAAAPHAETTVTKIPDGRFVIEGRTVTLRYADGRVEEKPVRIVATPVQRPVRRVSRNKNTSAPPSSAQNQ